MYQGVCEVDDFGSWRVFVSCFVTTVVVFMDAVQEFSSVWISHFGKYAFDCLVIGE